MMSNCRFIPVFLILHGCFYFVCLLLFLSSNCMGAPENVQFDLKTGVIMNWKTKIRDKHAKLKKTEANV